MVQSEAPPPVLALSEVDWEQIQKFQAILQKEKIETCSCCNKHWFQMKLGTGPLEDIYTAYIKNIRILKNPTDPLLFSNVNSLDSDTVPTNLPILLEIEEMLITRMHVHLQVVCVCGQQFRYTDYIVCFRQNTS